MIDEALRARLINWAICMREAPIQGKSTTAIVLDKLQEHRTGYRESKPRRELDHGDAQLVEHAWRKCDQRHKDLLKMLYVWNGRPEFICRKLRIPARPMHVFELRRVDAERQIARHLERPDSPVPPRSPHAESASTEA